jgi:hypothetical protein
LLERPLRKQVCVHVSVNDDAADGELRAEKGLVVFQTRAQAHDVDVVADKVARQVENNIAEKTAVVFPARPMRRTGESAAACQSGLPA